jgi:NSS family neurotransmitter:Na+ symporter
MAFTAHESWSGRLTFILAAVGSSVGLGNFWRFPYEAGLNGGGIFVLVYVICVFAVGLPVLLSELMIGRHAKLSAMSAAGAVAKRQGDSPSWNIVGIVGTLGGTLIVTFYSVIAGWIIAYLPVFWSGAVEGASVETTTQLFDELRQDPVRQTITHALFMGVTAFIIARGVRRGIERAVEVLMPLFFIFLLGIVIYAAIAGDFLQAAAFLFTPDFNALTPQVVLNALGQACFSIGVGSAIMITYGAYTTETMRLSRSSMIIAGSDTLVALIAGFAIFPFVFAFSLEPNAGAGLLFVTLPAAFGQLPGGSILGVGFLLLALFAALTSSISLLETAVSYAEERGGNRVRWAILAGLGAFTIGMGTVFSGNIMANVTPPEWVPVFGGLTFFGILDVFTSNIALPLAALLGALFAGWVIRRDAARREFAHDGPVFKAWRFAARWVCPIAIGFILIFGLGEQW